MTLLWQPLEATTLTPTTSLPSLFVWRPSWFIRMCSKILHTLLVSFFEFHNYLQQCKRSSLLSWRWKEIPILILIYTSQQPNYSIYTSTWLPETFYQRKLLILCISHSFTLILRDQVNNGVKTGIIVILPQVQGATSTTWVSSSPPPGPTVQYSQCVAVLLASLGWVRKAHGGGAAMTPTTLTPLTFMQCTS